MKAQVQATLSSASPEDVSSPTVCHEAKHHIAYAEQYGALPRLKEPREATFRDLLSHGTPCIIQDISLGPGWSPDALSKHYGKHIVQAVDTRSEKRCTMTLASFFDLFHKLGDAQANYAIKLAVSVIIAMYAGLYYNDCLSRIIHRQGQ